MQKGALEGHGAVEEEAGLIERLDRDPTDGEAASRLRLGPDVIAIDNRRRELRNFIDRLVLPTRSRRSRG